MKTSRRFFLSGASLLAAAAVAGRASAQDVIGDILKSSSRGNWDDQFDARASEGGKVASTLPIFSLQTVAFTEQAVAQYQNIVGQGGWVEVPDTKKLELGVNDPMLEVAMRLEEAALKDDYFVQRKLYPNVDFYSGIIYKALNIPTEMFTVMFAIARTAGWVAHWLEQQVDPEAKIGRPRQIYTGSAHRDYVPTDRR